MHMNTAMDMLPRWGALIREAHPQLPLARQENMQLPCITAIEITHEKLITTSLKKSPSPSLRHSFNKVKILKHFGCARSSQTEVIEMQLLGPATNNCATVTK